MAKRQTTNIKTRNIPGYNRWTKDIKQKFDFTCDNCNSTDKKVVSHHLDNYLYHSKLRTDINNGVCLCSDCHIDFHEIFGMGQNTREQYEQFKQMDIPKIIEQTKDKPIIKLSTSCRQTKIYSSISQAVNENDYLNYKHILWCCLDKWQMTGAYWWQFYDADKKQIITKIKKRLKNQRNTIRFNARPKD